MSKFLIVDEAPQTLEKGEYLIEKPSFMEEVLLHQAKRPKNGLTGTHQLRMILDSIAQKYDPESMTAYSVRVHNYEGRVFSSNEELSAILVEMLRTERPSVFQKYLDLKIRQRPAGTKLVYYVQANIPFTYETFYRYGLIDAAQEARELAKEAAKEDTPKRTVGKPAITNEQAEQLKQKQESSENIVQ